MELKDYFLDEHKIYVEVNTDHRADGQILPRSFVWEDGRRYPVDRIKEVCRAASLRAGGTGLRYTVMVRNVETFLFLEEDTEVSRWFMERK